MTPLAYLNGHFVPETELRLSFADAGFVFGATVTDYCRTYQRKLFRWPDHLARLRRDATSCHVPIVQTDEELTAAAGKLIEAHPLDDLAVITFATPGPLGYMTGGSDGPPMLGMHAFPIPPDRYAHFISHGVELEIVGGIPTRLPASVKHRSRLAWWLADRAVQGGRVPVLVHNGAMDTPIGAVLAVAGRTVYAAAEGRVQDSISVKVIEELCPQAGFTFERTELPFYGAGAIPNVTELMLTGTAFGLAGVRSLGGQVFTWPGPAMAALRLAWGTMLGAE